MRVSQFRASVLFPRFPLTLLSIFNVYFIASPLRPSILSSISLRTIIVKFKEFNLINFEEVFNMPNKVKKFEIEIFEI